MNNRFREMLIFENQIERFYAKDYKKLFAELDKYAKEHGFTDWDTMYLELKND